ncbi:ABC transporter permease [Salinibacter altiplanensis]|uniref:ABC transporter permease n=1 Tax=Salinibacter altiplanensis TaxID=1803181 RepID=UPI001F343448|nr:ABC transporter permease [Salinibacter altiplanensis]
MPPRTDDSPDMTAVRLLKGAALVFATLGAGMAAWGLDKWIRYPEARASQFGVEAPLWPAFTLFIVLAATVGVRLLWIAAGRAEDGEDLFARRHRRRRSDPPPPLESE